MMFIPTFSNPLSMAFQNIRTFVRLLHQLQGLSGFFADRLNLAALHLTMADYQGCERDPQDSA